MLTHRPGMTEATDWADRIVAARTRRPFTSLEEFARDTGLPKRALILLADADAFRSIGLDRRAALWAVRRLPDDVPLPLFEAAIAREQPDENAKPLPADAAAGAGGRRLPDNSAVAEGPPDGIFAREVHEGARRRLRGRQPQANDKRRIRCAGVVLVRQRPGSAKGVVFMTLEDETGIANIVVWPKVMEQYRKEVMGARLILVEGYIQSSPEHVTHLVAQRMFDRSHDLIGLANDALEPQASGAGRPRADRAAQRRPPRSSRYAGAKNPPPARRPHPAAVAGFSLELTARRSLGFGLYQ